MVVVVVVVREFRRPKTTLWRFSSSWTSVLISCCTFDPNLSSPSMWFLTLVEMQQTRIFLVSHIRFSVIWVRLCFFLRQNKTTALCLAGGTSCAVAVLALQRSTYKYATEEQCDNAEHQVDGAIFWVRMTQIVYRVANSTHGENSCGCPMLADRARYLIKCISFVVSAYKSFQRIFSLILRHLAIICWVWTCKKCNANECRLVWHFSIRKPLLRRLQPVTSLNCALSFGASESIRVKLYDKQPISCLKWKIRV